MQFNSHATGQDIVSAVDDYVQTTRDHYPLNSLTRNVNKYYKRAVSLIQQSDRNWIWDDKNNTNLPIITTDLENGQPDYAMPDDVRDILRIKIVDNQGNNKFLPRLKENEVHGSLDDLYKGSLSPQAYQFIGQSIYLYPATTYDQVNGLKVYGKRSGSLFETTDTTKEPGFDSQYHDYLAVGAAYEYAISPKGDPMIANNLKNMLIEIEREIIKYYSRRGDNQSMSIRRESSM